MANFSYTPINCSYYDELEALATLKRHSVIQYHDIEGNPGTVEGLIIDFKTRDKEEFLVMDDGREIRLDRLVAVNGKPLQQE